MNAVLKYAGKTVLDIGCSCGSYVAELAKRDYKVLGLDLLAAEAWQSTFMNFGVADINALPLPDKSFDTALAFEILEHLTKPELAIHELHRITRQNIIVTVPNCMYDIAMREAGLIFHHWIDRTHLQMFTFESLTHLLASNGFLPQEIRLINPVRPDILTLNNWRVPTQLAILIGKLLSQIPWPRRYYMTLLAIALKVD